MLGLRASVGDEDLRIALYACKRILTRLQLIDDAPASRLPDGRRPPTRAVSRIPEGVRTRMLVSEEHAPSRQFSLWAHYSWRMERALARRDAPALLKLAACATHDYEIHTGEHGVAKRAAVEERELELLRDFTGAPAGEVAWYLNVSERWVRRQRVLHGLDAELGEPRRYDERTQRILALREAGATIRTIAAEVGVSTGHVSNVVNGRRP